jgi:hypothetical protein
MTNHLVGTSEIAEMLAVSRARVAQLADSYDDFPPPQAELASGRIWSRTAVEQWIRDHPNRPSGRRRERSTPKSGLFFDRFDDAARQVVVLAQRQAGSLGHTQIGCEHLLLGLAAEPTGVARRVLQSLDADRDTLADALESVAPARTTPTTGHLPFTDRAKNSLEAAYKESLEFDSDIVSTEHILLGLLSDANLAVQLLRDIGITPSDVRRTVLDSPPQNDFSAIANQLRQIADALDRTQHSVST